MPLTPESRGLPTPPPTPVTPSRWQMTSGETKDRAQGGARCAEVAGGTAAECAAVICCCPCGLLNLLLLAMVKIPAGLCRRAAEKRRRKKRAAVEAAAAAVKRTPDSFLAEEASMSSHAWMNLSSVSDTDTCLMRRLPSPETEEMEKEMWARFYSTGFWRSHSQREER